MGDAGSTYSSATPKTDATDGDEANYSAGLCTFNIGQVAPGVTGKLYFCVRIQ